MRDRTARTRTLIQLGVLLTKTKFLNLFKITLGDDLQSEDENSHKAMMLLGLLKDVGDQLQNTFTDEQLKALKDKGLISMRTTSL
jgi:hypothetical protein